MKDDKIEGHEISSGFCFVLFCFQLGVLKAAKDHEVNKRKMKEDSRYRE